MDKATKTKIILFAGFGAFVLIVLAVCLSFTGKDKNLVNEENANTSLRAQTQSDFTLDDMMQSKGKPDYDNLSDGVYQQRDTSVYNQDPEALALQEQLRQNMMQQASDSIPPKKRISNKKKKVEKAPVVPAQTGRFFSGVKNENTGNTVEALVSGDQKITNGSVLKLVTLQELQLDNGIVLNKGTALFGVVELKQDRINVAISSVRIGNNIYDIQRTVYDRDGLPGVYVPLNVKAEAGKEAADAVVSDVNVPSSYSTDIVSTSVGAVTSAAKSVFRKKNNQIIVTVKSNYKLYLK